RDDQFAGPAVGYVVLLAKLVQPTVAFHAEPGFGRPRRVINSGVDYFAVTAAGLDAKAFVALQDQNFEAPFSQLRGTGEAHHPPPNDNDIAHRTPMTRPFTGEVPADSNRSLSSFKFE